VASDGSVSQENLFLDTESELVSARVKPAAEVGGRIDMPF